MSTKLPERVYTIEISNRGNSPVTFTPVSVKCYARWDFANNMNRDIGSPYMKALAMEFRDGIPGMCIQVDTTKFLGRIFWPQTMPGEGQDIAKRFKAIQRQHPAEAGGPDTWDEPREYKLTPDDMKHWLLAMAQIVQGKLGVFVTGSDTDIPPRGFILQLPGKLPNDPLCDGRKEGTGKPGDDRPTKYIHDVAVPKDYGVDHEAIEAGEFAGAGK